MGDPRTMRRRFYAPSPTECSAPTRASHLPPPRQSTSGTAHGLKSTPRSRRSVRSPCTAESSEGRPTGQSCCENCLDLTRQILTSRVLGDIHNISLTQSFNDTETTSACGLLILSGLLSFYSFLFFFCTRNHRQNLETVSGTVETATEKKGKYEYIII